MVKEIIALEKINPNLVVGLPRNAEYEQKGKTTVMKYDTLDTLRTKTGYEIRLEDVPLISLEKYEAIQIAGAIISDIMNEDGLEVMDLGINREIKAVLRIRNYVVAKGKSCP